MEDKAPAIECEASGSIVTVDDAAAMPVHRLVSHIVPHQVGSGDPNPNDNIRPIGGWDKVSVMGAGGNLYSGDRTVTFSEMFTYKFPVPLKAGTYRFYAKATSSDENVAQCRVGMQDIDVAWEYKNIGRGSYTSALFTLKSPIERISFWAGTNNSNSVGDTATFEDIQITAGDTIADFTPHQGQTLTADLPETVYGGTLDWKTGVLTVDNTCVDLGNVSWGSHTINGVSHIASVAIANIKTPLTDYYYPAYGTMCSVYKLSPVAELRNDDFRVAIGPGVYGYGRKIIINDSRITTPSQAAELLTGQKIVIPLETPYTIQLTPQQLDMLRGYNNVWSNCGDTSLVYVADTGLMVEKLMNRIAALEAVVSAPTT